MSEKIPDYVLKNTSDSLQLIYLIYGAGALTLGFTTILGVIWTYLEREKTDAVMASHVTYLFHTFWKSWIFLIAGIVLSVFFLGFIVILFWFVWLIIRAVRGFKALRAGQPIENPARWWF